MHSSPSSRYQGWLDASGLPHLLRTIGIAVQPTKLAIAFVALALTFAFGMFLDLLWGSGRISPEAVDHFILARQVGTAYMEPPGDAGPFAVLCQHERDALLGFLASSVPGSTLASGTALGAHLGAHNEIGTLGELTRLFGGVWWLVHEHAFFAVLLIAGLLMIWSVCGGAICRMAAVQFARQDAPAAVDAFSYVRKRLFDAFVAAPCVPLALALFIALFMSLGGLLLAIPVLGDLLGGFLFFGALVGGFLIFLLLLGLFVGGHLFWPAAAAEGADAFDAFSRGLSFTFTKPWKAAWYAVITVLLAAITWTGVRMATFFALGIARGIVGFGTSPFGWFARGGDGVGTSKMEALWPLAGPDAPYAWPDTSALSWHEWIAAVLIGIQVMVVIGFMWSFLASFYLSGSTVIYFLLRRDIDGIELEDIYLDDASEPVAQTSNIAVSSVPSDSQAAASSAGNSTSLPVIDPDKASTPPT